MGYLMMTEGGQSSYFNGAGFTPTKGHRVLLTKGEAQAVQMDLYTLDRVIYVPEVRI